MKQRFCKFCQVEITSGWPHLKVVCAKPECRQKLDDERFRIAKERSDYHRLKKKAERMKGMKCQSCGDPIPVEQRFGKPVCMKQDCMDWWYAQAEGKKCQRARKFYWETKLAKVKVVKKDVRLCVTVPKKKPETFNQKIYEREQAKMMAKVKVCRNPECGKKFRGPNHSFCPSCFNKNQRYAAISRCDGAYGGGEGEVRQSVSGIMG
jgi:hypothetical protein